MQTLSPIDIYNQQIEKLSITEKRLLQRKKLLSWLRFLSLAASFIALWQLWHIGVAVAFVSFIIFFGLFLFIVVKDLKNKDEIENTRLLTQINKQELEILDHQFLALQDGQQLKPENHAYANDLDIFGKASVYQYINRTVSEQGNRKLADWLLNTSEPKIILQRQEAAKELTDQIKWRQQLRAYGITNPITITAEKKIEIWLKSKNRFIHNRLWKIIGYLLPAIALTILILHLSGIISSSLFYPLAILFFAIAFSITKIIMPHYTLLNKIVPELETLQNCIQWIEDASFKSELMSQLKNNFKPGTYKASGIIKKLKKNLERFDYRLNPIIHIPLNTFLLWDLQQIMTLEKWKTDNNQNISAWFNALANTEALITIATLSFNHPQWCFPSISDEKGVFVAHDLGHTLIPAEKRVTNSFSTTGEKQLNLITGSNMAGKSTFLRSIGVNIVLAMMGAPACCSQLNVSTVKVISSMRVNDNLEENTSTFYAELKKLKEIIDAVNNREDVFLLLDEILRGTNSADRHTGSIALIKQLIHQNASGLIATHDLELTKLSDEFPANLHNYHFDVQIKNEDLYFDYKIKRGICTSMNASLLMKKIGIDL
jgi:MutS domain V